MGYYYSFMMWLAIWAGDSHLHNRSEILKEKADCSLGTVFSISPTYPKGQRNNSSRCRSPWAVTDSALKLCPLPGKTDSCPFLWANPHHSRNSVLLHSCYCPAQRRHEWMETFTSPLFPQVNTISTLSLIQLETLAPGENVSQTESSIWTDGMKTSFQETNAHQTFLLSHGQQKHRWKTSPS